MGARISPGAGAERQEGRRELGQGTHRKNWPEQAQRDPPTCITLGAVRHALNTGIACAGLRAVDIDVDDPALVTQAVRLAVDMLGATITRTRANSPRCLLVYRAAEGEPPKVAITGTAHSKTVARKIEALGKGQHSSPTARTGRAPSWSGATADRPIPRWQPARRSPKRSCAPS